MSVTCDCSKAHPAPYISKRTVIEMVFLTAVFAEDAKLKEIITQCIAAFLRAVTHCKTNLLYI